MHPVFEAILAYASVSIGSYRHFLYVSYEGARESFPTLYSDKTYEKRDAPHLGDRAIATAVSSLWPFAWIGWVFIVLDEHRSRQWSK